MPRWLSSPPFPPGTIDKYVRPVIEENGFTIGEDIHLVHAPERIIPGNMVYELLHNNRTIGADDKAVGEDIKIIFATIRILFDKSSTEGVAASLTAAIQKHADSMKKSRVLIVHERSNAYAN